MLGKTVVNCTKERTCDMKVSSFPLFMSAGNTSPWPGGYLHKDNLVGDLINNRRYFLNANLESNENANKGEKSILWRLQHQVNQQTDETYDNCKHVIFSNRFQNNLLGKSQLLVLCNHGQTSESTRHYSLVISDDTSSHRQINQSNLHKKI